MGNINNYKHGYAGKKRTRLYNTWLNMKQRCYNENVESFKYYGGAGITICDEWKNDFESFKEWALSNGYKNNLTIDRIDVHGNYEASNCRWITNSEQQMNKRNNHYISYHGVIKTLTEWSTELGLGIKTIERRLNNGWGVERAFSAPLMPKIKDLKDKKFGKLLVVELDHTNKYAYWLCICDCGNEKIVRGDYLSGGLVKSCGCLRKNNAGRPKKEGKNES